MSTHPLDEVDRLIIGELAENVRITYAELGARVGLSESQCLRRVRGLERDKIIRGYRTFVDPVFLNLRVRAYIEVRLSNDAQMKEFERVVDRRSDVFACWRVSGDADYLLEVLVGDPEGFERLLNVLAGIEHVSIIGTHLMLRIVKRTPRLPYSTGLRTRLGTAMSTSAAGLRTDLPSTSRAPVEGAGSGQRDSTVRPHRCVDDLDRRILHALADNARMSNAQLADRIGLSPAPCLRRLRALEALGVIQAYYTFCDYDALNIIAFVVMIRLKTQNAEWHEQFALALNEVPEIVLASRTNGASDYLLFCMASGLDGVEQVLSHRIFKRPGIESIESALCLRFCSDQFNFGKLYDNVVPGRPASATSAR
jgi:Lrp/AsnC family leucine-responsive transcriptional regulator